MPILLIGIFIVLHGLVHLLYFGLSQKYFDLDKPLEGFPERSWAFSSLMGDSTTRSVASALYMLATIAFVLSGISILFQADWRNSLLIGAAIFSSLVIILFWDGKFQRMPDKGFLGVLINIALVGGLYWAK